MKSVSSPSRSPPHLRVIDVNVVKHSLEACYWARPEQWPWGKGEDLSSCSIVEEWSFQLKWSALLHWDNWIYSLHSLWSLTKRCWHWSSIYIYSNKYPWDSAASSQSDMVYKSLHTVVGQAEEAVWFVTQKPLFISMCIYLPTLICSFGSLEFEIFLLAGCN